MIAAILIAVATVCQVESPDPYQETTVFFKSARIGGAAPTSSKPSFAEARTAAARGDLDTAIEMLQAIEKAAAKQAGEKPCRLEDARDPDLAALRRAAQERQVEAGLLIAALHAEAAERLPVGSPDWRYRLERADHEYGEIWFLHPTLAAASLARLADARLLLRLDRHRRAAEVLEELRKVPADVEPFAKLRAEALTLLLEIRLSPQLRTYREAAMAVDQWLGEQSGGPPIDLLAGTAFLKYAGELPADGSARRKELAKAWKRLSAAAERTSPVRSAALHGMADPLLESHVAALAEPANFEDAVFRADLAWEQIQLAQEALRQQAARGDSGPEHQKTRERFRTSCSAALRFYRLADSRQPAAEPSAVQHSRRFRMAWLAFATGDLEQAATLGEALAPTDAAEARAAAEIAAKARRTLFRLARTETGQREAEARLLFLAELLDRRWPGSDQAQNAWIMLIDTASDRHDWDEAARRLTHIPADSPKRAFAEARARRL